SANCFCWEDERFHLRTLSSAPSSVLILQSEPNAGVEAGRFALLEPYFSIFPLIDFAARRGPDSLPPGLPPVPTVQSPLTVAVRRSKIAGGQRYFSARIIRVDTGQLPHFLLLIPLNGE